MKNNSKDNRGEIEIELLLREALSIKQEPSQQLNGSIVKKSKEYLAKLVADTHNDYEFLR